MPALISIPFNTQFIRWPTYFSERFVRIWWDFLLRYVSLWIYRVGTQAPSYKFLNYLIMSFQDEMPCARKETNAFLLLWRGTAGCSLLFLTWLMAFSNVKLYWTSNTNYNQSYKRRSVLLNNNDCDTIVSFPFLPFEKDHKQQSVQFHGPHSLRIITYNCCVHCCHFYNNSFPLPHIMPHDD